MGGVGLMVEPIQNNVSSKTQEPVKIYFTFWEHKVQIRDFFFNLYHVFIYDCYCFDIKKQVEHS